MTVPSLSSRTARMAMSQALALEACPLPRWRSGGADGALPGAGVDGQVADGRRLARQRVGRVPGHPDLVEAGVARIVEQQPAGQALADAENLLQHLGGLQRAD